MTTTTRGICYIAFGSEYDKLAAYTIGLSRPFISCPITVLSNIPAKKRSKKWREVPDVKFIDVNVLTCYNREVKIQIYKYTPYDETIYLDCDSIVRRAGIEGVFDHLAGKNIVFQHHKLWDVPEKRYYRLYRDTAKKLGIDIPVHVMLGGFWAFRKSPDTTEFFEKWREFWKKMGSGRDMPSLAMAIKKTGIDHSIIYKQQENYFSFGIHSDAIVVHRMGKDDLSNYFGIPEYRANKPFDVGNRSFWDLVAWND
jgi:hypothetical protein